MIFVNGTMKVTCSQCNIEHSFSGEDSDFDLNSSQEREMGVENAYSWEYTFNCDCGNEIEINYEVWEYPFGVLNTENIDILQGTHVQVFTFDFHDHPEPNDN